MTKVFTIKPISNTYSQQVVDLILPIQQEEFHVPITLADQPDLLDIESSYRRLGGEFWGAFYEGELVGTIALLPANEQDAVIRKMFVKQAFRGKEFGIGQELLDTLIRHCREQGISYLYLGTVDMLKAAHRFYERNGFQRIHKTDLPPHHPTMTGDTVYYERYLNEQP
ncbi:MAG: GNAT family N-acetyltransferase [Candidatus Pseudobacter hemicellulosilyticus]|uniref:GNAT family N-acetyltransferase n=1 Tax=Candidatus Pseudobacter hemicellulosilyticus TaxID=3121375 RepID=A0AAJ6BFB0_9BACT|nr:MAG: GNAT family N-acetyltransferase [Pseudobacter sp.]